jgi:2-oxoglutarate dehydrogenase E2 component (dihydrolipoamide succinyltransferase)
MAIVNVIMPKLGESIMEATVLKWHKKVGDMVRLDETLLDIATDKVDSEVPSTAEGILEEILCKENDVISIGAVIAKIRTSSEEEVKAPAPVVQDNSNQKNGQTIKELEHQFEEIEASVPFQPSTQYQTQPIETGRFYSPLVMNIATTEGIPLGELEKIPGTGNEGRLTKKDILNYLENRTGNQHQNGSVQRNIVSAEPKYNSNPITDNLNHGLPVVESIGTQAVEVIEMDRMRKLIAEHMTRSKATSAHVTSFAEIDVTNLVLWREKKKKEFEKREGEKITFTPLLIEGLIKCIKKFPLLNSSVSGDKILVKKIVNIGMATALPNGNLIVPVIKNADQLNLLGLTREVNRLANTARNGKLSPTDTTDGTFTFTNVGTFGSLMGTPIINQPQVAILATGAIKKKPVVVETEKGDSIAIRHMMFVSLSYDHRIIDGAMGSSFLGEYTRTLESFDSERIF